MKGMSAAQPVLDHGYVRHVESWGRGDADEPEAGIIEAARQSTQGSFRGWETDERLLGFLFNSNPPHATPFEFAGMVIEVQAPIFVFREWHRHRTQCLAGDTMLHFDAPKSQGSRRSVYKMPLAEAWRKWQPTVRRERPERQENALWGRSRLANMLLRCVNEETREVIHTRIVDIVKGEEKQLYRVRTIDGKTVRASADHRFFTNLGWLRLEEAVARGALLSVTRTEREMAMSWDVPAINEKQERWVDVVGWEGIYEVSDFGRVRRCGKDPKRGTVGAQGYPVVSLNRPGLQQTRTVHTLVLEAFSGPRPVGHEARHLNHNRLDPWIGNLEWGSSEDNSGDMLTADRQQRLNVGFEEIASCERDGVETTYDVAVAAPWHNFVADGFVVHNSYNEMSARYAPLPDLNYLPTINRIMSGGTHVTSNKQAQAAAGSEVLTEVTAELFRVELASTYNDAELRYQRALSAGIPKELARCHLPVGRYSRMRAQTNLRNWLAFLTLRSDPGAQWEIRQFANAVGECIAREFPRTWALYHAKRQ